MREKVPPCYVHLKRLTASASTWNADGGPPSLFTALRDTRQNGLLRKVLEVHKLRRRSFLFSAKNTCRRVQVHVKETQTTEISSALHYSFYYHIMVLGC